MKNSISLQLPTFSQFLVFVSSAISVLSNGIIYRYITFKVKKKNILKVKKKKDSERTY